MAGFILLDTGSAPATPASGKVEIYAKTDKTLAYKNDAGTEVVLTAASATSRVARSSFASPTLVTTQVAVPLNSREKHYIAGAASSAQTLTANPRIAAGSTDGQELVLCGCSDTATVTLLDGQGVKINGDCILNANARIELEWDNGQSLWVEVARNDFT